LGERTQAENGDENEWDTGEEYWTVGMMGEEELGWNENSVEKIGNRAPAFASGAGRIRLQIDFRTGKLCFF
jgi:hypothetical protein